MSTPSRLYFYGASDIDRPFIQAVAANMGIGYQLKTGGGLYRWLAGVPRLASSGKLHRLAQILSPWFEAIEIFILTRRTDLILIRNIRTAISYLYLIHPLRPWHPPVAITWFTLKGRPSARWSKIYRQALRRAFRIFVFTPSECDTYASWFELPTSLFALMTLEAPQLVPALPAPVSLNFDVIMTGETNRDWSTFHSVCQRLPHLRFAGVMPGNPLESSRALPNLKIFKPLPFAEYCELIRSSTIQLILVEDKGVAVGQRDFLLAGQLGRPVIATAVEAIQLYDPENIAAIFVQPSDLNGISEAITSLISNADLRARLASALQQRVARAHSLVSVSSQWADSLSTPNN